MYKFCIITVTFITGNGMDPLNSICNYDIGLMIVQFCALLFSEQINNMIWGTGFLLKIKY